MTRLTVRRIAWIAAGVWMALIFAGSTYLLASNHTSRFFEPLLRWRIPGIDARTSGTLQFVVRKFGPAFEYGVTALLTWHAL